MDFFVLPLDVNATGSPSWAVVSCGDLVVELPAVQNLLLTLSLSVRRLDFPSSESRESGKTSEREWCEAGPIHAMITGTNIKVCSKATIIIVPKQRNIVLKIFDPAAESAITPRNVVAAPLRMLIPMVLTASIILSILVPMEEENTWSKWAGKLRKVRYRTSSISCLILLVGEADGCE